MDDYELDDHVRRMMESVEREIEGAIFGASTSTSTPNKPLTLEKMQEMINHLFPPLYYGTATHIERGTLYYIKESEDNPEYIIFHPGDFETIQSKINGRTLVHIKDEPQEKQRERLLNKMRRIYPDLKDPQKVRVEFLDKKYDDILAEIVKSRP